MDVRVEGAGLPLKGPQAERSGNKCRLSACNECNCRVTDPTHLRTPISRGAAKPMEEGGRQFLEDTKEEGHMTWASKENKKATTRRATNTERRREQ